MCVLFLYTGDSQKTPNLLGTIFDKNAKSGQLLDSGTFWEKNSWTTFLAIIGLWIRQDFCYHIQILDRYSVSQTKLTGNCIHMVVRIHMTTSLAQLAQNSMTVQASHDNNGGMA